MTGPAQTGKWKWPLLMSGSCRKCFNSVLPEVRPIHLKLPVNFPAKENTHTHAHTSLHKWLWLGLAVGLRKFNHLNLFSLFSWWKSSVRFQHEPVRAELLSALLFMLIRYRHEMEESRIMSKNPEWIRRVGVCGRPLRLPAGALKGLFIYESQDRSSFYLLESMLKNPVFPSVVRTCLLQNWRSRAP